MKSVDYNFMTSIQHNTEVRMALAEEKAERARQLAEKHEEEIETIKVWSIYLGILMILWLGALAMGVHFD